MELSSPASAMRQPRLPKIVYSHNEPAFASCDDSGAAEALARRIETLDLENRMLAQRIASLHSAGRGTRTMQAIEMPMVRQMNASGQVFLSSPCSSIVGLSQTIAAAAAPPPTSGVTGSGTSPLLHSQSTAAGGPSSSFFRTVVASPMGSRSLTAPALHATAPRSSSGTLAAPSISSGARLGGSASVQPGATFAEVYDKLLGAALEALEEKKAAQMAAKLSAAALQHDEPLLQPASQAPQQGMQATPSTTWRQDANGGLAAAVVAALAGAGAQDIASGAISSMASGIAAAGLTPEVAAEAAGGSVSPPPPRPEPRRPDARLLQLLHSALRGRRTVFGRLVLDGGSLFTALDRDGDGQVSPEELHEGLKRLELPVPLSDLEAFLECFGTEAIRREDLLQIIGPSSPTQRTRGAPRTSARSPRLTLEAISEQLQTSQSRLDAWRNGAGVPSADSLAEWSVVLPGSPLAQAVLSPCSSIHSVRRRTEQTSGSLVALGANGSTVLAGASATGLASGQTMVASASGQTMAASASRGSGAPPASESFSTGYAAGFVAGQHAVFRGCASPGMPPFSPAQSPPGSPRPSVHVPGAFLPTALVASPRLSPRPSSPAPLVGMGDAFSRGWSLFHEQEDGPGLYTIINRVAVEHTWQLIGESNWATVLEPGTLVNVLEVKILPQEQRVRARVEAPAGWISLTDTTDGFRWARKAARSSSPPPAPRPGDAQLAAVWRRALVESALKGREPSGPSGVLGTPLHPVPHPTPPPPPPRRSGNGRNPRQEGTSSSQREHRGGSRRSPGRREPSDDRY